MGFGSDTSEGQDGRSDVPRYSDLFKQRMTQRLLAPRGPSFASLSRETGVKADTLAKWLREAQSEGTPMRSLAHTSLPSLASPSSASAPAKAPAKSLREWSPQERLQVVVEVASLSEEDIGAYLRTRGLHESTVQEWRATMLDALAVAGRPRTAGGTKEVRALQRELDRKDKALAEAAALLVLQKKLRALWEVEDDAPGSTSGG